MSAESTLRAPPIPLEKQPDGTLRIAGTRISLERVLKCHLAGQPPERIVELYDTLSLQDVYFALGYYFAHKAEVEAYMRDQDERADRLQNEIESIMPSRREEMLARWAQRETENAQNVDRR
jgi:uncharacterized protein (DUF433 family)